MKTTFLLFAISTLALVQCVEIHSVNIGDGSNMDKQVEDLLKSLNVNSGSNPSPNSYPSPGGSNGHSIRNKRSSTGPSDAAIDALGASLGPVGYIAVDQTPPKPKVPDHVAPDSAIHALSYQMHQEAVRYAQANPKPTRSPSTAQRRGK